MDHEKPRKSSKQYHKKLEKQQILSKTSKHFWFEKRGSFSQLLTVHYCMLIKYKSHAN